jgi:hypothetical protein
VIITGSIVSIGISIPALAKQTKCNSDDIEILKLDNTKRQVQYETILEKLNKIETYIESQNENRRH